MKTDRLQSGSVLKLFTEEYMGRHSQLRGN